jgi:NADH-quinone oxidoreductase subunit D
MEASNQMAVATPPVVEAPVIQTNDGVGRIRQQFSEAVLDVLEFRGETTVTITREALPEVARFLRDQLHFEELTDVTVLDWLIHAQAAPVRYAETLQGGLDRDEILPRPRFDVLYLFLSMSNKVRLRLRVQVGEFDANVPTLTEVYAGANFYEREVFDLFGINFVGHPFMHRILLPDDTAGHPLRKDHPLGYEPVEFTHTVREVEETKPKDVPPPRPQEEVFALGGKATEIPLGGGLTATPLDNLDDPTRETMLINMGPHHPSTHGVLRVALEVDGEKIVSAMPDIGYLHTGIEKNMEYKSYIKTIPLTDRMDYLSPLFNNLGYCLAVEKLMQVEVPERANILRVLLCEINRISSHLVAVGTNAMDIGAVSLFTYTFREREAALDIFEMVSGARMMTSYFRIGGVAVDVPAGFSDAVRNFLKLMPPRLEEYQTLLDTNPIWLERTRGVGAYTPAEALSLGITGPLLRATGVNWDLRKALPYCGYETYEFDVPLGNDADIYTAYRLRVAEMWQSLRIVEQALQRLEKTPGPIMTANRKVAPPPKQELQRSMESLIHHFKLWTEGFKPPVGFVYAAVESPRGELGFLVSSDGSNKPHRVHVRAPSFANLQLLPPVAKGRFISDLVGLIAMTDIVLGDVDR